MLMAEPSIHHLHIIHTQYMFIYIYTKVNSDKIDRKGKKKKSTQLDDIRNSHLN